MGVKERELEYWDLDYIREKLEANKEIAERLGLSLQDWIAFRTCLAADSIDDKLDDLSVTTYQAPNY